jgi:hypothetical protein
VEVSEVLASEVLPLVGLLELVIAHVELTVTNLSLYVVVVIARESLENPHLIDHYGLWAAARQVCLDELVVKTAEN